MSNKQTRVRKITPNDPEYWQEDSGPIVARSTFVPPVAPGSTPAPAPLVRRAVQPIDITMPQQSTMNVDMRTSARDRAAGFSIETHQLSIVVGGLAVLVAVFYQGNPFLAIGTIFTFGVWYTVVWLGAWLFHRIVSPEGLAFFNAVMMWLYVFRRG